MVWKRMRRSFTLRVAILLFICEPIVNAEKYRKSFTIIIFIINAEYIVFFSFCNVRCSLLQRGTTFLVNHKFANERMDGWMVKIDEYTVASLRLDNYCFAFRMLVWFMILLMWSIFLILPSFSNRQTVKYRKFSVNKILLLLTVLIPFYFVNLRFRFACTVSDNFHILVPPFRLVDLATLLHRSGPRCRLVYKA